jgi:hypothetical protein
VVVVNDVPDNYKLLFPFSQVVPMIMSVFAVICHVSMHVFVITHRSGTRLLLVHLPSHFLMQLCTQKHVITDTNRKSVHIRLVLEVWSHEVFLQSWGLG